MKLLINYDLINEISKANTGIDLKRFSTKMGIYMGTLGIIGLTTIAAGNNIYNPVNLAGGTAYALFVFGGSEFATCKFNKRFADSRLNILASSLRDINIYTDLESIKKAQLYKTQFKVIHDDKVSIQQNKYIMLPTTGCFNADTVSLLQEHRIGSREYALSIGEPNKVYKKDMSRVFAR